MTRESPPGVRVGRTFAMAAAPLQPPPIRIAIPGPVVTAYNIRGATLAYLREECGLTQRELAVKTAVVDERVSRETIKRIEASGQDVVRVTEETARALAAGLGVDLDRLFL